MRRTGVQNRRRIVRAEEQNVTEVGRDDRTGAERRCRKEGSETSGQRVPETLCPDPNGKGNE